MEEEPSSSPSQRRLYCEGCGERQQFNDGDDGFFYCALCGSQSQDLIVTQTADEDVMAEGGLYNLHLTRSKPRNPNPNPKPAISKQALFRALSGNLDDDGGDRKGYGFDDTVSEPRDFGSGSGVGREALAEGIWMRYVEGLQVMVESQCEPSWRSSVSLR